MPRDHTDKLREVAIGWFIQLKDADADDPLRSKFEQWLMANVAHQQAYADVANVWASFDSPHDLAKLADTADQDAFFQKSVQSKKIKNAIAGAVAAVAISVGGWLAFQTWQAQPVMQMVAQVAVGQVESQRLQDGTLMTMNTGTDIEVTYYRDRRLVTLKRGEAIFEVARDETRPFIIDSGKAKITVLGTRFAVNRLTKLVRVSVDHGTVKVEPQHTDSTTPPSALILHDGEVAEVKQDATKPMRSHLQAADAFAFEKGMVVFEQADLDEIAETLSRYRKLPLVAEKSAPQQVHISSMLKTSAIETFIYQMPEIAPVHIVATPTATLIKSKPVNK
jgi:transmembrane sensor